MPFFSTLLLDPTQLDAPVFWYQTSNSGRRRMDWQAHAMVQMVEVFACQILNYYSHMDGISILLHAAWLFSQDVQRVNARIFSNIWFIVKEHPPGQVFPQVLVQMSSTVFEMFLVRHALTIPWKHWLLPGVQVSISLISLFSSDSNYQDENMNFPNWEYRIRGKEY